MLNIPEMALVTAYDDIDFRELRHRPTVLYVIVPSERISHYAFFLNVFYTQLFQACMRKRPHPNELPIHILFDEFGHCKIPDFQTIITTIRKYKVSLSLILQSLSQLQQHYGKDGATTILHGGVNGRLVYAGLDPHTAKVVEELLGQVTYTEPYRKETLMSAYKIRTMQEDDALFITGNKPPIQLNTKPHYRQKRFAQAARYGAAPLNIDAAKRTLHKVGL